MWKCEIKVWIQIERESEWENQIFEANTTERYIAA